MRIDTIQSGSMYQTAQSSQIPQTQSMTDTDKINSQTTNQLPQDEYISSKNSFKNPSGLYKVVPGENGKPKILYDDPKKSTTNSVKDKESEMPKDVQPDNLDDKSEQCTINTNKVDQEIKKIKEQKKQLEQQIKSAAGDEKKIKELEAKLANVESELSQKDTDSYRRQNANVS